MKQQLVVVGNGMAGMRTVEELLRLAPDLYEITVFGAEPYGNYNRIQLSPVLAGELELSDIMLNDFAWYEANGVRLYSGDAVERIDRARRTVHSATGVSVRYDRLLLATGSSPFVPPIPGVNLPGVLSYRDISDTKAMMQAAAPGRRAVVVGGGLLGLEAAAGLAQRGMQVSVVHLAGWLMERQLDRDSAAMLQASLESRGLSFYLAASTESFESVDGHVCAVQLTDGPRLDTDLVVIAAGIRPNVALARAAGIHCARGVVVNDVMQSYDPRIYAVGECAEHRGIAYGLVAPLYEQAKVCATQLAQWGVGRYLGSVMSTRLKVTGLEVFSAGEFSDDARNEDLVLRDPEARVYRRAVIRDGRLIGAVMVGDTSSAAWLNRLVMDNAEVAGIRQNLLFDEPEAESIDS
jgi:nitrite reductase (NADH) large subunit